PGGKKSYRQQSEANRFHGVSLILEVKAGSEAEPAERMRGIGIRIALVSRKYPDKTKIHESIPLEMDSAGRKPARISQRVPEDQRGSKSLGEVDRHLGADDGVPKTQITARFLLHAALKRQIGRLVVNAKGPEVHKPHPAGLRVRALVLKLDAEEIRVR